MAVFKCKMCGANLPVEEGKSVCQCEYCGTRQTLPTNYDERIVNLFNRANYLRANAEFDKAQETYEQILSFDYRQAEAHWGIVLCKYGVEYVEDTYFGDRIPTCHRTQPQSILADDDYLMAVKTAFPIAIPVYEAEARQINEIQKKILSVVKNEKPYDVFICYKERGDDGKRTHDSVIGTEIYHQLKNNGFNVFFAAITLEDKLGVEYEPYIYAALTSAKVMIVLGTKPEYFSAVWVKNEWSRYLQLMKTDRETSRTLIPCYKDMDAYDLPADFSHLQALNMGNIAFIVDLIRAIQKLLSNSGDGEKKATDSSSMDEHLKHAFMLIEDGGIEKAGQILDGVLNHDSENGRAYLGKFLIYCSFYKSSVRREEDIRKMSYQFISESKLFRRALMYSDKESRERLEGIIGKTYYDAAMKRKKHKDYLGAMNIFSDILSYMDSKEQFKECTYYYGINLGKQRKYTEAIEIFEKIRGYKDADALIERCHRGLQTKQEKKGLMSLFSK